MSEHERGCPAGPLGTKAPDLCRCRDLRLLRVRRYVYSRWFGATLKQVREFMRSAGHHFDPAPILEELHRTKVVRVETPRRGQRVYLWVDRQVRP